MRRTKLETSLDIQCDFSGLYTDGGRLDQLQAVAEQLKPKIPDVESYIYTYDVKFTNLTFENLKNTVEIYLYLNTCSEPLKHWYIFYKNLFETQSTDQIILTLNRMMKVPGSQQNDFSRSLAQRLLQRVASSMTLKFEEVKSMIPGPKNKSFANPSQSLNKLKEGTHLHFYL